MQGGWIKLHRKLKDNAVFASESGLKVWVWCLLKARHERGVVLVGKQMVHLRPGQFIFGRLSSSEELNMKPSTVRNWIMYLQKEGYLDSKATNKYSVITVLNWEVYQDEGQGVSELGQQESNLDKGKKDSKLTSKDVGNKGCNSHSQYNTKQQFDNNLTTTQQQNDTNKNVKKVKNVKKKEKARPEKKAYGEFKRVFLADEEKRKLKETFGETKALKMVVSLDRYIESIGKDKYKNHYATLLNWERRDRDDWKYGASFPTQQDMDRVRRDEKMREEEAYDRERDKNNAVLHEQIATLSSIKKVV